MDQARVRVQSMYAVGNNNETCSVLPEVGCVKAGDLEIAGAKSLAGYLKNKAKEREKMTRAKNNPFGLVMRYNSPLISKRRCVAAGRQWRWLAENVGRYHEHWDLLLDFVAFGSVARGSIVTGYCSGGDR